MKLAVPTPLNFNFRRTVMSHGWCVLLPFEFDKTTWTLVRVLEIGEAKPVTVSIASAEGALALELSRRLKKKSIERIVRDVRRMFRLDDDMREFYESTAA